MEARPDLGLRRTDTGLGGQSLDEEERGVSGTAGLSPIILLQPVSLTVTN